MGKPSRVVVLAEDQIHQQFARRHLYRLGYQRHEIHMSDLPSGRGCGEQWVRDRYAREVRAGRRRQAETALVAVIDADRGDVDRRFQQMRQPLERNGLAARGPNERIVHLIPKRNIETWILCLNGVIVEEELDYKGAPGTDEIPGAVAAFFDGTLPTRLRPDIGFLRSWPQCQRLNGLSDFPNELSQSSFTNPPPPHSRDAVPESPHSSSGRKALRPTPPGRRTSWSG